MRPRFVLGAALCAAAFDASASCGAAFCLVNTDWSAQGFWTGPGGLLDLRYESIDLDQPRAGNDKVGVGEVPRHHDEVETRNRNWVATFDWNFTPDWGATLTLPYVDREHFHIHNHHSAQIPGRWDFTELGDMRVQGRYRFDSWQDADCLCAQGLVFGLKVPTGKYDVANGDGEAAERTLQPGTGTTDLLLGYDWHRSNVQTAWSYFTRVQAQLPLNSRAEFKPGAQLQVDGGMRYAVGSKVALMLQANAIWRGTDKGANAEPEDSGQRAIFVSPGVSWNIAREVQAYAFVQVPVYWWVTGVQLTSDWSAAAGVSWRF